MWQRSAETSGPRPAPVAAIPTMVIIGQNEHFMDLLKEIVQPYQPAVSHDEAGLLLDCHNGTAIFGSITPLTGIGEMLADSVWEHLLFLEWGDTGEDLDTLLEKYDAPTEWGPEITGNPRFQFVERLRKHTPFEAVALHIAIFDWWNARTAAGSDAHDGNTPHLALHRFFNLQG